MQGVNSKTKPILQEMRPKFILKPVSEDDLEMFLEAERLKAGANGVEENWFMLQGWQVVL